MPEGLMSAFLAASSQPFTAGTDGYRARSGGLDFTLRASGLQANADGARLEVNLVYAPGQVMLRVNDKGAAYPLTIDLLIYPEQKVIASDGEDEDYFGYSVALSGDTALVGAYRDDVGAYREQGSAYVFTRSGTTWSEQAQLTASDHAYRGRFGVSVALSGDTALVGADRYYCIAFECVGRAYVFTRSGTTWSQQSVMTPPDGAPPDTDFGHSVALWGDTALVGVPYDYVGANKSQGSAYVFTRSDTSWRLQQQLTASDGAAGDNFGISVALSDDTALVGAYGDDVGANKGQGSAYVFTRSGTTWSQQQQLTASDGAQSDHFGISVALSGDTALVGAHTDIVGANVYQGSAYVFTRTGTTWTQQQKLTASDGEAEDYFGIGVAVSGDTALVGAAYDEVDAETNQGSVYVFTRSGTTWSQQEQLTATDGATYDYFGVSVALSSDTALVGASEDDVDVFQEVGSAYFYTFLSNKIYLPLALKNSPQPWPWPWPRAAHSAAH
jgi:hypothetical protein